MTFEPKFMECLRKIKPKMSTKRASAIITACSKALEKRLAKQGKSADPDAHLLIGLLRQPGKK